MTWKLDRRLFSLLAFSASVVVGCGSGHDEKSAVSIAPSSTATVVGGSAEVTIKVQHVKKAYYTAFDLTYDPEIIEFISADEGAFLSQNGADDILFAVAKVNGTPGKLTVGVTRLGTVDGVSGGGSLLTLTFQGLSPGSSPLTFSEPRSIRDPGDVEVSINAWKDGLLTVN